MTISNRNLCYIKTETLILLRCGIHDRHIADCANMSRLERDIAYVELTKARSSARPHKDKEWWEQARKAVEDDVKGIAAFVISHLKNIKDGTPWGEVVD